MKQRKPVLRGRVERTLPRALSSVQLLCHVQLFVTPWTAARQASLSITNSQSLLRLIVHQFSDAIQPPQPLSFPSLPTFNFSQHQGLFHDSVLLIRWPKYWSFSFNISSYSEYSGLISFRMDWLDLLAVHRTFNNLLQHHNLKSINSLVLSLIYGPTLHPYMTTGKTIPLTVWIYVGKVMSLFLFFLFFFLIYCLGL